MNIINIQGGSDFAKIHFAKFFESMWYIKNVAFRQIENY